MDLKSADLNGVDFFNTALDYTDFFGADLSDADLRWADLMVGTILLRTRMPDGSIRTGTLVDDK
ncbi:MAG TPA: hypothetical protein EYQ50_17340 [Verrucomicrobiales bacterium]|nr:hypothetical protein [Verrucomicrobiales bacterium]